MAFRQPRIPEYKQSGNTGSYLSALALFLKDFTLGVWSANNRRIKEIQELKSGLGTGGAVTKVNGKTGDVTLDAASVGARSDTWLPSKSDLFGIQKGTWNGNTPCSGIPAGISYVEGAESAVDGFPENLVTCLAVKMSNLRCFQLMSKRNSGKTYVRASNDASNWGEWNCLQTADTGKALDAYPVGSIYISASATSPASLFGGTWEQIKDRFLLSAGGNYAAGATGGATSVALTAAQMPTHAHQVGVGTEEGGNTVLPPYAFIALDDAFLRIAVETTRHVSLTSYAGSGAAHTNMPPYLAVYMWKRVS